jgi:hypothetical protein
MGLLIDKSLILNKIKLHYGFKNDAEFARYLGIKPNTLSNWHIRNTMDYERVYTKCEEIDGNFILTGKEPMLRNDQSSYLVAEPKPSYNLPSVITVDSHQRENIPLVSVKARAGYLDGYYKTEYVKNLPTYRMPGLDNGTFRAFQVKGQSMNLSLHDKSYAVGQWVENWIDDIKDDRIYIIVHEDWESDKEGILIKRCINRIKKYGNLSCKSDNLDRRSYPNINIEPSTIKEVWEVKGALVFEFTNPALIFDRINDLEAETEQMKVVLRKLSENQNFN